MDEDSFRRILDLFPVVRSPDYHADSEPSRQSTSHSAQDEVKEWQDAWNMGDKKEVEIRGIEKHDAFWDKLKLAAERKVAAAEAERFCEALQRIHEKLVNELSSDAAQGFASALHPQDC
ncbi:uncharacterized protein LOC131148602 [Malania oleifera]|uniref:uncharacterized protein LOC131148602 n=1 Tax=Malania oleifera TaxID=397392 RepID=UPI0025AE9FB7|nr:uncharacterized protein LOC131148602 [Malania oleifera]